VAAQCLLPAWVILAAGAAVPVAIFPDINSKVNHLNTNLIVPQPAANLYSVQQLDKLLVLAAAITQVWPSTSRGSATPFDGEFS
jgi:hypothetical protein